MDFALIYERTENDHDIYARYELSDAKTQLHKIDEIRIWDGHPYVPEKELSSVQSAGTG